MIPHQMHRIRWVFFHCLNFGSGVRARPRFKMDFLPVASDPRYLGERTEKNNLDKHWRFTSTYTAGCADSRRGFERGRWERWRWTWRKGGLRNSKLAGLENLKTEPVARYKTVYSSYKFFWKQQQRTCSSCYLITALWCAYHDKGVPECFESVAGYHVNDFIYRKRIRLDDQFGE